CPEPAAIARQDLADRLFAQSRVVVPFEVLHDPLEPFTRRQLEPFVQLGEFAVDDLVVAAELREAEAVDREPGRARRRAGEQRRQRPVGGRRGGRGGGGGRG